MSNLFLPDFFAEDVLFAVPQQYYNVVKIMQLFQKHDIDFTVNTVLFRKNVTELERISSLLEEYGAKEWHIGNLGEAGRALLYYEEFQVPPNADIDVRLFSDLPFPVNHPPEDPVYKGDCTAGRNKVTINADGTVMWCPLCTQIEYPFLNIKKVPLLDQWQGEQFDQIRHYVETPSGFCAHCHYCDMCDGCPVINYMYFSRFDMPPPDCFFRLKVLGLDEVVGNPKPYIDTIRRKEDEFRERFS